MASASLRCAALCVLALTTTHCATPGGLRPNYVAQPQVLSEGGLMQIQDGSGYLSYQTPLPHDFPGFRYLRRARGEVCQNDLQLPLQLQGMHANSALSGAATLDILWGNAAVAQGVADAMSGAPAGAVLYDLTLDLQKISVLGLFFRRQCLVVSGSLALPVASSTAPAAILPEDPEAPAQPAAPLKERKANVAPLPLRPIPRQKAGVVEQLRKYRRAHQKHGRGGHTKSHSTRRYQHSERSDD